MSVKKVKAEFPKVSLYKRNKNCILAFPEKETLENTSNFQQGPLESYAVGLETSQT